MMHRHDLLVVISSLSYTYCKFASALDPLQRNDSAEETRDFALNYERTNSKHLVRPGRIVEVAAKENNRALCQTREVHTAQCTHSTHTRRSKRDKYLIPYTLADACICTRGN